LNRFVLDTSVALAWCFEDETSAAADRILDLLASSEAIVSAIWPVEVGNALLVGERRKRITPSETARSLALLRSLNIHLDDVSPRLEVDDLVLLARSHSLSLYDAAYLSLAMREGIPLATLDRALAEAARRTGITLLAP
jgi:predicted nucleic acid-binding protein